MTNFKALAERLGLDEDEFVELIELFVATSGVDVEKIEKAIEKNDFDKTAKAAHSLKGASGSLGLRKIAETARKLETNARNGLLADALESIETIKKEIEVFSGYLAGRP